MKVEKNYFIYSRFPLQHRATTHPLGAVHARLFISCSTFFCGYGLKAVGSVAVRFHFVVVQFTFLHDLAPFQALNFAFS